MARSAEKQARTEAVLGELSELGLMLARELAIQARAAEEPAEKVALADAFHRTARTVRLTLALDAKLDRDAARDAREAELDARREAEAQAAQAQAEVRAAETRANEIKAAGAAARGPVEARKGQVRNLMRRLLWTESEGDGERLDVLDDDLDARLDEAGLAADFETLPIETVVARIAADMGLSGKLVLTLGEPAPPKPKLAPEPEPEPASELKPANTG